MVWQSGGGGGYPGVTSDGHNGLTVLGGIVGGQVTDTPVPSFWTFTGSGLFEDSEGNGPDGDSVLIVQQLAGQVLGSPSPETLYVHRGGDISAQDYVKPTSTIEDTTASAQPVLRVNKSGTTVLELTTRKSVTGALSTVTDAAAKAVLTSVIAALTGLKVATNNTT